MKKTMAKNDSKGKVQPPVALIRKEKKDLQSVVGEKLAPPAPEKTICLESGKWSKFDSIIN